MPATGIGDARLNRYQQYFERVTLEYRLPEGLLRAIASVESSGDPRALSDKGAVGLMQFMPTTGREYGLSFRDRYDPAKSIDAAGAYMRDLLNKLGGDTSAAIRAYYAGEKGYQARGLAYRQSTSYLRRVLTAWGKGEQMPLSGRSAEERQATLDTARKRRDAGAEAVAANEAANVAPGGIWNPANWRYFLNETKTQATASIVLLAAGIIFLYIGMKNA